MITSKCRNVLLIRVVSQGHGCRPTQRIKYSVARLIYRLRTTVKGKTFNSCNVLNYVHVQVGSDELLPLTLDQAWTNCGPRAKSGPTALTET